MKGKEFNLSEKEIIEVNSLISYYSSLDLDVGSSVDFPSSEKDILNGLIKLLNFYNLKHKKRSKLKKMEKEHKKQILKGGKA